MMESYVGRKSFRSALLTDLKAEPIQKASDHYVKFLEEHPFAAGSALVVEVYKPDKFASVDPKATAFSHRFPCYNVNIVTQCVKEEEDKIAYQYGTEIKSILNEEGDVKDYGYVNYGAVQDNTQNEADWSSKAKYIFGQNLDRLRELKKIYDPTILFNKGVTIRP
jgi:hypothetical protein